MAKYLKHDTEKGYIEDNAEIEYTQFNNLRHTILGCMLGDFDSQGRYVVAPEIRDELIQMPKYLVDSMENVDICASVLKLDKQLSFLVTYEGNRATLSLMEKMSYESNAKLNSGSYSNIVEYLLDEIETSGVVNKSAVFAHWNISEFGGAALDVFNMDDETLAVYFNVVNRFKYLMVANKLLLKNEKELEEIEAEYANRIFNILEGYPKLKAAVEKEIKETLEEKKDFIRLDKPNFAKTLNEIIDKAVENNLSVLSEKQQEEFKTEKHIAQMEINIRRREVIDVETKPIEAENTIQLEEGEVVDFVPEIKSTIIVLNTDHEDIKEVSEVAEALVAEEKATVKETEKDAVKALLGDLKNNRTVEDVRQEGTRETNDVSTEETNKRLLGRITKKGEEVVKQGGGEQQAGEGNKTPPARQTLVDNINRITGGKATVLVDDTRREKVETEQQKREEAKKQAKQTDTTTPVYAVNATPPANKNVVNVKSGGGGTDSGKGKSDGKGKGNTVNKGQAGTKKTALKKADNGETVAVNPPAKAKGTTGTIPTQPADTKVYYVGGKETAVENPTEFAEPAIPAPPPGEGFDAENLTKVAAKIGEGVDSSLVAAEVNNESVQGLTKFSDGTNSDIETIVDTPPTDGTLIEGLKKLAAKITEKVEEEESIRQDSQIEYEEDNALNNEITK